MKTLILSILVLLGGCHPVACIKACEAEGWADGFSSTSGLCICTARGTLVNIRADNIKCLPVFEK